MRYHTVYNATKLGRAHRIHQERTIDPLAPRSTKIVVLGYKPFQVVVDSNPSPSRFLDTEPLQLDT
jgi:hypothetical protein